MDLELAYLFFSVFTAILSNTLFSNFFQLRNFSFCLIGTSNKYTEIVKKTVVFGQIENILVLI